jgi:hypothetical protein
VACAALGTLALGCMQSSSQPNLAAESGSGSGGSGSVIALAEGGLPCAGCAAGTGCVDVVVGRFAGGSQLPWILGVPGADGSGELVVSAVNGGQVLVQARQPADMTSGTTYTLSLSCVEEGQADIHFFLDEGSPQAEGAFSSDDGTDACGGSFAPRQLAVRVVAGERSTVTASLDRGCADSFD